MADELCKLKINGKEISAPAGTSILEAARQNGVLIPHFCYHPYLSVAGSCRMCQVEIEGTPKLQISCATPIREGMNVLTESDRVQKARHGVLEMLLLNHPVDCPVCDQAGECALQDYYMKHAMYESRFDFQKKKAQKVTEIGPHLFLDQERCVLCTRCVRFCEEITHTNELVVRGRGYHNVITTFLGASLDNPYSGNVVDICPVGALLSKDFRFQSRIWFLEETSSVCPGCSRGCNIRIGARQDRIYRLIPREHSEVNAAWMCDDGRFGFGFVHDKSRRSQPTIRNDEGELEPTTWPLALAAIAEKLQETVAGEGKIAFLGSAQSSCETLYLLKRLAAEVLPGSDLFFGQSRLGTTGSDRHDEFLEEADKNPNTRGALELGLTGGGAEAIEPLKEALVEGKIQALVCVDLDPMAEFGEDWKPLLEQVGVLVLLGWNHSEADSMASALLPLSTFAEHEGTFVNSAGRVQRFRAAIPPQDDSKPGWQALSLLASSLGSPWPYKSSARVFESLATDRPAFSSMNYKSLGDHGLLLVEEATTTPAEEPENRRAFSAKQWSWERRRPWE